MAQAVSFIGFGEAAGALVTGWAGANPVSAYDIKTDDLGTAASMRARYADHGVQGAASPEEALAEADLVFCTVTADQAVVAAERAAPALRPGSFWCDLNSCAPASKRQAAQIIESAGGRYVDVAVMAPVHPLLNRVPVLVSGPHATEIAPRLANLPMSLRVIEGPVGAASSIKMIRSVMVKGLEALTAECVLAAVAAGIEGEVLGSLAKSHPGTDWARQAVYNFERSMVHGARRAAEMEEVGRTLRDLGLPDDMTRSTVAWQTRLSETGLEPPAEVDAEALGEIALALLGKLRR